MDNWTGKHTKGYELQERIGGGGFGAVYRAYQSTIGREVAIKIILPEHANQPDFIRRFEVEAQLIARLEHHHIVPLYDFWRDPDGAFLVMRWLRGGSLLDRIQTDGALSIEDTVLIIDQITQALHTAHRSQVVHRDIKPGNILMDEDQNAFLADFGIAKDHTLSQDVTDADAVIGSPDYLAPEQARSEPVTPQTDIYSLGVVLYEMLEGNHPFPELTPIERLYKHLNDPLPELTTPDNGIRAEINQVIQQATAKDPMQRFKDVLEFTQALRNAARLDSSQAGTTLVELLTPREQAVLQLIIQGQSNREIADELVLSVTTVKSYIKKIYRKLNVRSRVQAIVKARELDLIVSRKPGVLEDTFISSLPEPDNPYKGLRAFHVADEKDFFGRDKLIHKLIHRLQEDVPYQRFLAVVGPSGSGKSSVVNAGLVPALWRGDLPGSDIWYVADLLPGPHPLDELEVALTGVSTLSAADLREHLTRDERGLTRAANLILPEDGSELLVVIDQFEEVFTLVQTEPARQHFLSLLVHAVTSERSRVRVVITLRADYYDRPLQYPEFGEILRNRVETVLPLSADELEEAIRQPAVQAGITFEDGLVSQIVSDVHYQPGSLPLLQYALTELFERRDGRQLTRTAYTDLGGAGGALAKRADEIYLECSDEGRELIHQMFLRLVMLGEGAEDTRRRVSRDELLQLVTEPDLMDDLIDQYAQSRLLSLDHNPATRTPTVEVAHEAILREWERLRTWLNESRDDIKLQRQLAALAAEWHTYDQDVSYLVHGSRLEQFQAWADETELSMTPLERNYLAASVADEAQQQADEHAQIERENRLRRQRLRILQGLVAVFLIAAVVAGGLALFAFDQQATAKDERDNAERERDTQTSILLAAMAEDELGGANPERGVLLALEALEHYPFTAQANAALINAVEEYRSVRILEGVKSIGHEITIGRWSPDGTRIAAGGDVGQNSIIIWDVATGAELLSVNKSEEICTFRAYDLAWSPSGERIAHISFVEACGIVIWDTTSGETLLVLSDYQSSATSVDWSPDGAFLVTGHEDGTVTLWDADTGGVATILTGHEAAINDVAWSPDNQLIATASADGTVRLWDAENGTAHMVLEGHVGDVNAVAWSPDSTRLVTAGHDVLPRIWDATRGEPILVLPGHDQVVIALDWSQDGYRIASVESGRVRVWHAATGAFLFEIPNAHQPFVAFSPDNEQLATASSAEYGQLFIWDIPLTASRLVGHIGDVYYANWSPAGRMFASIGQHDTRFWDAVTGQQLASLPLRQATNAHGDWAPDGTRFVMAFQPPGADRNEQNKVPGIIIWDATGGETVELPSLPLDTAPVTANWSPDGAYISSGVYSFSGPHPVYVWDAVTYELLWTYEPDDPNCMQPWPEFSPDSSKIVAACFAFDDSGRNTSARILDVKTGELLMAIEGKHGSIFHVIWSPDGQRVLATYSGVAEIWDPQSGTVIQAYAGHGDARVWGADWHPDGIFVVTGDASGVVKVWHSETGEEIASYFVDAEVQSTHWSPDGTHIIIAGRVAEPIIKRVWLSTDELIAHAYECCVTRELTPEERAQFGLPARTN